MGKRGPTKTPTKILEARGSWRADGRDGELMPPDLGTEPEAPEWLNGPAFAKWEELAPICHAMRVLTVADAEALARYCRLWQRWLECEDFIDEHGIFYTKHTECGVSYVRHPVAVEASALIKDLARLEAQFGLTPAARASISLPPAEKPDNDEADFFGGAKTA